MNVFGIEGMWNLTWIIPVVFWIGIFAACYWPYGKGPEGPPYVGFDPGENYTGRHRFDAPQPLIDVRMFGESMHGRTYPEGVPTPADFGEGVHPGKPCGPVCWRKPDGHRWGDTR